MTLHSTPKNTLNAAIVGATGYSGIELARLIINHPAMQLNALFTRDLKWHLHHELPGEAVDTISHYETATLLQHLNTFDAIFLATPPKASMALVKQLANTNKTIIDLSGAFRLPKPDFMKWYNDTHDAPEYIEKMVYGLSPWWQMHQTHLQHPTLISNPGCYATCALLALLPLLKHHIIKPNHIIIDAKSGISGAGREANTQRLFTEITNNFFPYKIGTHQHLPEISHYLKQYTGIACLPILHTQILPLARGISMNIYADPLDTDIDGNTLLSNIQKTYQTTYANYPLICIEDISNPPASITTQTVALKQVVGTCRLHLGYTVLQGKILIVAVIDNLLKGAASQAIETINYLLGLPLETGLFSRRH